MQNYLEVHNDHLTIDNFTSDVKEFVDANLTYTDKSKQYQLRRMAKSAWSRSSPAYAQLQSEVNGQLYQEIGNKLVMSSGFVKILEDQLKLKVGVDYRKETGSKVAFPWVKKPYTLRDYQEEAVDLMLNNPRGLINLATGLGKTLLALHFVQRYKRKALIVCPSESVARQFYKLFQSHLGSNKVGFYGGGKKKICDVTIGIAASVTRGIADFQSVPLGVVIIDETHHTPATTFFDIAQGLGKVGKMFGLTATDYRSDGKDIMITAGCGPVLIRRDIKWGVENGWLAKPYFFCRRVDTNGRDFKDDKIKSYKEHVLNCKVMLDQIREDARKMMAAGKKVLILVDEVAHGEALSKELSIPFATGIDSKSQDYVDAFNAGKHNGIVGTDGKIGEGSDLPGVNVLILANFVASKGPVIQAVGRGLRKEPGKDNCIVLDYIPLGSTMLSRHGYNRVGYFQEITNQVKLI